MGQKTILTPTQRKFLELVEAESYLTQRYYWTGGTVLSEIHLHHRNSEDKEMENFLLSLAKSLDNDIFKS